MMTKLSLWLTYIASCNVVYVLQLISEVVFTYSSLDPEDYPSTVSKLQATWENSKWIFIVLLILIVFSNLYNKQWKRVSYNTRIKYKPEADSMLEIILATVAYLMMVVTLQLNAFGIIATVVIMFALGLGITQTGSIHICLHFLMQGYHIYSYGKVYILTKRSMEEYRLLLDEEPNGIEARQLTEKVYIC